MSTPQHTAAERTVRLGLIGAGRRRDGTGPFLAVHAERAGARVVAVVGRQLGSAQVAAAELASRLGHAVTPCASLTDLAAASLDGWIVASPDAAHRVALEAAAEAAVPVLCEKPLVPRHEAPGLAPLLARFRTAGVLLMEHCQWPEVIPVFDALCPGRAQQPTRIAMGLSPSRPGPSMFEGSLSHLLSLAQALLPIDARTRVARLTRSGDPATGVLDVEFELERPFPPVRCRLELRHVAAQPRPAWVAIDGVRMDREIDLRDYAIAFRCGDQRISAGDPSASLVYRFVRYVREATHERTGIECDFVEHRARLFAEALDGFLGGG
ncbi:MAG: Gfo/Idh/MocA family oxidoreductase [Planctomycetes bacterium]|nr:Gfo/Idh/MocA family oxidoreductase [Planctomycetota bacterium]MCB9888508.1 Gfo/Idh/MocA family oxidoreductase [Planctomycetota bacterium]